MSLSCFSSTSAWFPGGAKISQLLPFVFSHDSQNQSIIDFRMVLLVRFISLASVVNVAPVEGKAR
jgi:hypothetical protein